MCAEGEVEICHTQGYLYRRDEQLCMEGGSRIWFCIRGLTRVIGTDFPPLSKGDIPACWQLDWPLSALTSGLNVWFSVRFSECFN